MTHVAAMTSSAALEPQVLLPTESAPPASGRAAEAQHAAPSMEAVLKNISARERDGIFAQLNKTLEAFDTHVRLSLDEKSHQTVIRVIDNDSGKVIRQIPNEQLLKIAQSITELLGVIYDEKM